VWVSGLFDLNRQDLTEFKRPLTEYYDRFNRILDRGAWGGVCADRPVATVGGVRTRLSG
jgi:hypothetical protein